MLSRISCNLFTQILYWIFRKLNDVYRKNGTEFRLDIWSFGMAYVASQGIKHIEDNSFVDLWYSLNK